MTVLWATRIYAGRPSAGSPRRPAPRVSDCSADPLTGGVLAETTSLTAALLGGAAIVAVSALLAPRGDVIHG